MSTYIIGFCFMDCGPIASGLAYNGDEANPEHTAVKNVVLKGLIWTTKIKYFLQCWNISVHEWLKNYIFMRMLDNKRRGTATKATLVTFIVSGIWHGFYPGYIIFFLGSFFLDSHQKVANDVLGPATKGVIPDVVQNVFIVVFYYFMLSYFCMSFLLMNFEDFHRVYLGMYYSGHIFIIGTLLIMKMFQPKKERQSEKQGPGEAVSAAADKKKRK